MAAAASDQEYAKGLWFVLCKGWQSESREEEKREDAFHVVQAMPKCIPTRNNHPRFGKFSVPLAENV
jgi:hypothetical protein